MQAETTTMESAVQQAWNKRPLIISGPCSAETEEQVLETAHRLKATGKVDMLRAGIWNHVQGPEALKVLVPKDYHGCKEQKKKPGCQ